MCSARWLRSWTAIRRVIFCLARLPASQEPTDGLEVLVGGIVSNPAALGLSLGAQEEEFGGMEIAAKHKDTAKPVQPFGVCRIDPQGLKEALLRLFQGGIGRPAAALERFPVPDHVAVLNMVAVELNDHRIDRPERSHSRHYVVEKGLGFNGVVVLAPAKRVCHDLLTGGDCLNGVPQFRRLRSHRRGQRIGAELGNRNGLGEARGPWPAVQRFGLRLAGVPYGLAVRLRNLCYQRGWRRSIIVIVGWTQRWGR